ncbi:MAG: ribonuclease E, partial [Cyanobium sp.]
GGGGGRRRRGGRGGRGGDSGEGLSLGLASSADDLAAAGQPELASEAVSRRQEPEVVTVPMDDEQERLFGWMGLNPALLLDPIPSGDALIVRVVRPGVDPEAVIEEARQQAAANGSRRRRRGRGGVEGRGGAEASADEGSRSGIAADERAESFRQAAYQVDEFQVVPVIPAQPQPAPLVTVEVPLGRAVEGGAPAPTTPPPTEPVGSADQEDAEASGEPRRRRRRSSALV